MQYRKNFGNSQNLTVDNDNLESMENFIYLGPNISNNGGELNEISERLMLANKTYSSSYPP